MRIKLQLERASEDISCHPPYVLLYVLVHVLRPVLRPEVPSALASCIQRGAWLSGIIRPSHRNSRILQSTCNDLPRMAGVPDSIPGASTLFYLPYVRVVGVLEVLYCNFAQQRRDEVTGLQARVCAYVAGRGCRYPQGTWVIYLSIICTVLYCSVGTVLPASILHVRYHHAEAVRTRAAVVACRGMCCRALIRAFAFSALGCTALYGGMYVCTPYVCTYIAPGRVRR